MNLVTDLTIHKSMNLEKEFFKDSEKYMSLVRKIKTVVLCYFLDPETNGRGMSNKRKTTAPVPIFRTGAQLFKTKVAKLGHIIRR